MKKSFILLETFLIMCSFPILCYAESIRMDKALMTALGQLLQMFSSLLLIMGIGFLFMSYKAESAEMKTTGTKILMIAAFLYAVLPLARAGGFAL